MIMVAGLGNPGAKYEGTRHNMGFEVVDILAEKFGISVRTLRCHALIGQGIIEGEKVLLVKPQTFMNLSGEAIGELVRYFNLETETELIVISDDIDLDVGRLRIRRSGSAGGHNGLKNIISHLGTEAFARIRVGVGKKPEKWDLADYVLSRFSPDDRKVIDKAEEAAAEAVLLAIREGINASMNLYNKYGKPEKPKKVREDRSLASADSVAKAEAEEIRETGQPSEGKA